MLTRKYWIAFVSLLHKEISRFIRIWVQTLMPPMVTVSLYFLIFGNLEISPIPGIRSFTYRQYIAPGLIMMMVIANAYTNVASSVFGMRFQKNIEELLVAPVPNYVLLSGFVLGGVARGLLVGLLVTSLALIFTHLPVCHLTVLLIIVPLTASLFALAGFTNALFARKFDDITIIPTFILTPLIYLGGVFYSIDLLPPVWRQLSLLNPILHIINAFRYALLGITEVQISLGLSIVVLCCFGLFGLNLYLLRRGCGLRT